MQVRPGNAACGPNEPHNLPLAHPIAILHQYFREVQIRGKHPFAVIDVHYITREVQIPRKHHLTIGAGKHLLSLRAAQIKPLVYPTGLPVEHTLEAIKARYIAGHRPHKGQDPQAFGQALGQGLTHQFPVGL